MALKCNKWQVSLLCWWHIALYSWWSWYLSRLYSLGQYTSGNPVLLLLLPAFPTPCTSSRMCLSTWPTGRELSREDLEPWEKRQQSCQQFGIRTLTTPLMQTENEDSVKCLRRDLAFNTDQNPSLALLFVILQWTVLLIWRSAQVNTVSFYILF